MVTKKDTEAITSKSAGRRRTRPASVEDRIWTLSPTITVHPSLLDEDFVDYLVEEYGFTDRRAIILSLWSATLCFDGTHTVMASDGRPRQDSLDVLADKIVEILDLLDDETNIFYLAKLQDEELVDLVDRVFRDLEKLRKLSVTGHTKVDRRKSEYRNLNLKSTVEILAGYWMSTDRPFTQDWEFSEKYGHKKPATDACAFVYDVVERLDPTSVKYLPTITKNLVSAIHQKTR